MQSQGKGVAYDEVSSNQNWRDSIQKERNAQSEWSRNWGFLAHTEDGRGFASTKDLIENCEKHFAHLSEGKPPIGFSTSASKIGKGNHVDDAKRHTRCHFKDIKPSL